jgi:predicted nuclease with RNAse H fold
MRTVGVDLAAEPVNTAIAVVEWEPSAARVVTVELPGDDDAVLRHADEADKIGIDCPLGWPDSFVEFLVDHQDLREHATDATSAAWRRSLAYRHTDEHVRGVLGVVPLSVSTDRIGLTAMRAAQLQVALAHQGHSVDRAGSGLIVEVYPAAGLKHWNFAHQRYKGSTGRRALDLLVTQLRRDAPWLDLGDHETACRNSDHVFDAVVSALLARAAALGRTIPPDDHAVAGREGWIAHPTCALSDLVVA